MRNESDLSTYEEESDRVTAPPPKKQKIYEHKIIQKKWEKDSLYKSWILPVKTDCHKAYCRFCMKELVAGLSELKKHMLSNKHKINHYQRQLP